ncbi:MAG: hypothetical protein IKB09_01095 [Oscillospiraceae bacterium]|nr:hypothetical protein [Oscillospiraceae bacterium]
MDGYIAIATVIIAISLWNLGIAVLGLFPQCLSTAVGTLVDTNTKKNVRTPRGRKIPILTRYIYVYTIKGKEYRYSAHGEHSKHRLPLKATMVYVKWFPRRAYPDRFKGTKEWALGLVMLYASIRIIYAIVFVS